jgi:hypothetical protein
MILMSDGQSESAFRGVLSGDVRPQAAGPLPLSADVESGVGRWTEHFLLRHLHSWGEAVS